MIYLRNPEAIDSTWHFVVDDVFSEQQIDIINQAVENTDPSTQPQDAIRKNTPTWLANENDMQDVYNTLANIFRWVNDTKFQFALDFIEPLQHLSYDKDDHFDWHIDDVMKKPDNSPIRKISCSILLNEDYEGGEFSFASKQHGWEVGKIKRNSAIFFPSFMPHTVSPITQGNRQSLIAWARGPNFI